MKHDQDTYEKPAGLDWHGDAKKIRVFGPRILVREDKIPDTTEGGIVMPEGSVEHILHTGTILAFGFIRNKKTGEERPIDDLEVGLKCVYIRFLREQHTNIRVRHLLDNDLIIIGPTDILGVYPEGEIKSIKGW